MFALAAGSVISSFYIASVVLASILHHGYNRFAALYVNGMVNKIGIDHIGRTRAVFVIVVPVFQLESLIKNSYHGINISLARFI
jgi:hypothetical protein